MPLFQIHLHLSEVSHFMVIQLLIIQDPLTVGSCYSIKTQLCKDTNNSNKSFE